MNYKLFTIYRKDLLMKKRLSHFICCLLTSCIMLSETCTQAATYQSEAQNISAQAETSTTVSTFDDFFKALGKYKHIIVAKSFQTAASFRQKRTNYPNRHSCQHYY